MNLTKILLPKMNLEFYNTLSKEREEFAPIHEDKVRMYTCGPTVYNYPHIGNYRAYIFADIIKRVLLYDKYNVEHVMNITDIDDKTIRESKKEGKSLKEFTEFYTEEFIKDIKSLNIIEPTKWIKATDYISDMVALIEELLKKGFAYKSNDGSIYYSIEKFPNYGALSGTDLKNQKQNAGGRITSDEYDKDSIQDFALWKAWDEGDSDVFWESSLGKGRPGWHIECSAMSMKTLGNEIDIHTGGVDNIFPHHENEIAQSEGATGKKFVKYWMHNEWVLVDKKKMAKSENNFFTLKDIVSKNINPVSYRFWLLMANYRTRVNFVWEALEGADTALKKLYRAFTDLEFQGIEKGEVNVVYKEKFQKYISDDLDTPRALTLIWDVLKDPALKDQDKKATILDFDKIFGLGFDQIHNTESTHKQEDLELSNELIMLLDERKHAKERKDFKSADDIRTQISDLGYDVLDTPKGQDIKRK